MKWKLILLIFIGLVGLGSVSYSQISNMRKRNYYELSAGVGITNYFGDIGGADAMVSGWNRYRDLDITNTRPLASLGFRYYLGKYWASSIYLTPAWIAGDDKYSKNRERNSHFETTLVEVTGQLELYATPFTKKSRPYIFGGGGGIAWLSNNVFNDDDNRKIKLRNTWTYYYGIGFKREIEYYYSVGINLSVNYLTSDYLDGYKGSTLIEDMYFFTQIEFSVKIARRSKYDRKGMLPGPGLFRKRVKKLMKG